MLKFVTEEWTLTSFSHFLATYDIISIFNVPRAQHFFPDHYMTSHPTQSKQQNVHCPADLIALLR